jgi:hypothetical protein
MSAPGDTAAPARTAGVTLLRALAIASVALPFVFASIRAARTGDDFRYFWPALASLLGAAAVVMAGRSRVQTPSAIGARSAGIFVISTICAVLAALLLGTRLGAGIMVVGAAFGLCNALGTLFDSLAQMRAAHHPIRGG